jgi:5,10-methylenetetrahydromethanopterin reductase
MEKLRLGVALHGTTHAKDIVALARQAEALGFEELWLSEDYFFLGGLTAAAIALQATTTLKVGLGVLATIVRHPAVVAMEAATLGNAFPGRFELAIGHGVSIWVRQMGLNHKSPLTSFREGVTAIKRLLAGETVDEEGEYFKFRDVKLHEASPNVPVLGGVIGPKSVDLAGEVADGLIVSVLAGPNYVAQSRNRIETARKQHGRANGALLPVLAITCLDPDVATAKATLRQVAAFYLAAVGPTDLTGAYGVNEHLAGLIAKGGLDAVAGEMPDEWLEWLGIYGSPDHCKDQIQALSDAGATSIALMFSPHETISQQMTHAATHILPRFR